MSGGASGRKVRYNRKILVHSNELRENTVEERSVEAVDVIL
jgi:hypothetical protein